MTKPKTLGDLLRAKLDGPTVRMLDEKTASEDAPYYRATAPVRNVAMVVQDSGALAIGLVLADDSVVVLSYPQALKLRTIVKSWLAAFVGHDPAVAEGMALLDSVHGWHYTGPVDGTTEAL